MSHNYDVIKIHANEGTPKTFSGTHFELALKIADFFVFSVIKCSNTHAISILFHRTLSEGQEIDSGSKNFLRGPFRQFEFKHSFFALLSLHVDLLRGYIPICCLSVDESRDTVKSPPIM